MATLQMEKMAYNMSVVFHLMFDCVGVDMNYYNFQDTVKVGEKGVKKVISALKKQKPSLLLFALDRQNHRKVGYDIELVVENKLNEEQWITKKIEVKTDRNPQENFFIELISQKEKSVVGSFLSTNSDYLFYLFLKTNRLYIFETKKLKNWIEKYSHAFPTIPVRTPAGDKFWTTIGIKVPIKYLAKSSLTIRGFFSLFTKGDF